jgi:uncharacterized protein DUF1501
MHRSLRTIGTLTRRQMLQMTGLGFGTLALSGLLDAERLLAESGSRMSFDLELRPSHFAPRAKSVIMLMQNGGPSQMELFDPKPELNKRAGQVHHDKVEMFQPGSQANVLLGCPFKFEPRGESGMEISEALPHLAELADELCLVRSMHTGHNNHTESLVMLTSGKLFPGRPTLGSWISYALGTENQNLPSYIVLRDPDGYPGTGSTLWQNGWLPALYRGTEFNAQGPPVLNLRSSVSLPEGAQDDDLEFLARLNERHRRDYVHESALDARIRNYELAARMQLAAGDVLDLSKETEATHKMYGLDRPATAGYGARCLMARRLVESGVRFVQVFPGSGNPWDSHGDVKNEILTIAGKTDLPSAALIRDLKLRGLLENTIVVWTGEFGRLPVSQNGKGRDHNRNGFSLLLAGGGFKAGYAHGATDDVGYRAVEKPVHVTDLFATLLHQLGLDHNKLTYRHHGRNETLTDSPVTGAKVVGDLIAGPVCA